VLGPELVSERPACQVLGQARSTQRGQRVLPDEQARPRARVMDLATQYGRYGYRRITGILHNQGWQVNHKRVERIWRQEGLKVPQKQPKRRRLWLNDGSCVRLRPASVDRGRTLASAGTTVLSSRRRRSGLAPQPPPAAWSCVSNSQATAPAVAVH
jgi:transposase InsO family protein